MTALADESVHTVARRLGALGVLHKPFDVDDLRTAVMNAVVAYARVQPRGARQEATDGGAAPHGITAK